MPAGKFELLIIEQIGVMGADELLQTKTAEAVQMLEVDRQPRKAVQHIDQAKLRTALAAFQPVWATLTPREQERILHLLIERITYNPDGGDVDIMLRPSGIEKLAKEATP